MALLLWVYKMLNKSKICNKYIQALGSAITISKKDGTEDIILGVAQSFWHGGKARYEKHQHPIGITSDDYFCLICPPSYDITKLSEDDIVSFDKKHFSFVNAHAVKVGDKVQFYVGTLKRIWEAENVFI